MRRSQLQPVIMATAAGGKMMAMSAMMMSDPRTMVSAMVVGESGGKRNWTTREDQRLGWLPGPRFGAGWWQRARGLFGHVV